MNIKTKTKFSILLSFLLTLVMVVGLLPMGQVAYAEEVYPDADQVSINEKYFYNTKLYYTNGAESTGSLADNPNWNAHYDPTTGILELNNFDDGAIRVGGSIEKNITIKLTGTNKITSTSQYGIWNINGGDITITADSNATLEINVENSETATGISADTGSSHTTGSVTLQGYADVIVKANTTGAYKYAYGIKGCVNASVIENASFKAICSGTNNGYGYGIYAAGGVTIDTNGTIDIDVTGCAGPNNICCIGGTHAHTLTKVGKGILKYPSAGGAIAPASSEFSESTHAINKDPINCVESYRYGTPYTVTVESGMADVYGLMNIQSARFVKGDTVTVTANTISDLTFKKWTSADVTVASETSAATTFTMPDKDVTVTANYNLFTTEPSFTKTSDTKGMISFTLSTTPSSAPKLVEKDSDTVVGSTYFYGSTLDRSNTVTDGTGTYNVPAGEYRIAVEYGGTWLYSDVFTVSYAAGSTFNVTFTNGGNTTFTGEATVIQGTAYTCTIVPDTGYELEKSYITVKSNHVDVNSADWTYDAATGDLVIAASAVIGNIEIYAKAADARVDVTFINGGNTTFTGEAKVIKGTSYTCTIVPDTGYELPKYNIIVKCNNVDLNSADWTYDAATGELVIAASAVTGNIQIYAKAVEVPSFNVTFTNGGNTAFTGEAKVIKGTSYTCTIVPDTGYELPKYNIIVKCNNVNLNDADWTYDATTGKLEIAASAVTDNITIYAKAVDARVNVTFTNGGNTTFTGEDKVIKGTAYTCTIVPDTGYELPKYNIIVKCNNVNLNDADWTYDATTGKLEIAASAVTDNITIYAKAVDARVNVTFTNGGNTTFTGEDKVIKGTAYTCTIVPDTGYELPKYNIIVKCNNVDLNSADWTYDAATGELVIAASAVTGNIRIYAKADEKNIPVVTYTVSFAANGGTGTMADVTGISGEYTLPANGFTAPAGKQFKAWSVNGVEKAVGDKITVTANTTVTAVWEDIPVVTYTVSFDANGGTGSMADVTGISGEYTLPANGFTAPAGKQFKAWSVNGVEKAVGDKITVTANTTVTAVWEDIPVVTYTVSFDANGGTGSMADVTGVSGEYTLPANGFTAPDGKQFKAWSAGGVEKAAGDKITVTANTTITAVWENIPAATYKVTVTNGTGGGNYAAGATVSITANEASTGEMFDKWEVVSGSITLADANSATTTFVMPAGAVSVKATYKEAPHTHSYGSEWKTDADKHWHECSCGDKSEEAAHTAGDWITDTAATATTDGTKHKECTVCGYVMETATIPATGIEHTHNYSSDWKADADEHWNECECGDKANKAAHADENNDGKCDICDYAMGNADNPGGEIEPDKTGLSGGAIAGIVIGSVAGAAALGCGGFAIFWFVIKKKKFADLIALFKKK